MVRPATPLNGLSGTGSTVRSGLNLPIASASLDFSSSMPRSSLSTTDFNGAPGSARSTASRASAGKTPMMTAVPDFRAAPTCSWIAAVSLLPAKCPTTAPAAAPTATAPSIGGANRPTSRPAPPPQPAPRRPMWLPVSMSRGSPSGPFPTRMMPWLLSSLAATVSASALNSFSATSTSG